LLCPDILILHERNIRRDHPPARHLEPRGPTGRGAALSPGLRPPPPPGSPLHGARAAGSYPPTHRPGARSLPAIGRSEAHGLARSSALLRAGGHRHAPGAAVVPAWRGGDVDPDRGRAARILVDPGGPRGHHRYRPQRQIDGLAHAQRRAQAHDADRDRARPDRRPCRSWRPDRGRRASGGRTGCEWTIEASSLRR